jgi:hypothetical protein
MNLIEALKERIGSLFGGKKADTGAERFDTRKLLELVSEFEIRIKEAFQFELLQVYYAPYAFGSGHVTYRIEGRNIQIAFDGRENLMGANPIEVSYSKPHARFPTNDWIETKSYSVSGFWDTGINDILEKSKSGK